MIKSDLTVEDFEAAYRVLECAREHYDTCSDDMTRAVITDAHYEIQCYENALVHDDHLTERVK